MENSIPSNKLSSWLTTVPVDKNRIEQRGGVIVLISTLKYCLRLDIFFRFLEYISSPFLIVTFIHPKILAGVQATRQIPLLSSNVDGK